VREEEFY